MRNKLKRGILFRKRILLFETQAKRKGDTLSGVPFEPPRRPKRGLAPFGFPRGSISGSDIFLFRALLGFNKKCFGGGKVLFVQLFHGVGDGIEENVIEFLIVNHNIITPQSNNRTYSPKKQ